jgi:hypothetical protein
VRRIVWFAAVVVLAGCGDDGADTAGTTVPEQPAPAPAAAPLLSRTGPAAPHGEVRDGIRCETREFSGQHIHPTLVIVLAGQRLRVPANIGIHPDRPCLYWLHTHDTDGVLHVEAPDRERVFRLADFFAVWGYPIGPEQLFGVRGPLYAFVNGRAVAGDPGQVELRDGQTVILTDEEFLPPPAPVATTAEVA